MRAQKDVETLVHACLHLCKKKKSCTDNPHRDNREFTVYASAGGFTKRVTTTYSKPSSNADSIIRVIINANNYLPNAEISIKRGLQNTL
jgi:hypothetical protein